MLKADKKDYKEIDTHYIDYVTVKKIANCNNINSVNPLYLMINEIIGHFEEKEVETINGDEKMEYGRDFKKLGLSLMMICQ